MEEALAVERQLSQRQGLLRFIGMSGGDSAVVAGTEGYPWPQDFYDECAMLGPSLRISPTAIPKLSFPCRCYCIHPRAIVVVEGVRAANMEEVQIAHEQPWPSFETWTGDWLPFYQCLQTACLSLGVPADLKETLEHPQDWRFFPPPSDWVDNEWYLRRLLARLPETVFEKVCETLKITLHPGVFMYTYLSGVYQVFLAETGHTPEQIEIAPGLAAQGVQPVYVE